MSCTEGTCCSCSCSYPAATTTSHPWSQLSTCATLTGQLLQQVCGSQPVSALEHCSQLPWLLVVILVSMVPSIQHHGMVLGSGESLTANYYFKPLPP
jgi:hypothetical protein